MKPERTEYGWKRADADGLPDRWERLYGYDPFIADDAAALAANGLTLLECALHGIAPTGTDFDGDGVPDFTEARAAYTNSFVNAQGQNVTFTAATSPANPDTDGDGLTDAQERALGADPAHFDTDGDGLPDGWESAYGFDPLAHNSQTARTDDDADADPDGDGLTNLEESLVGTDPLLPDTDGDGIDDAQEIVQETDPTNPAENTPARWVSLTCDGDEGVEHSESATVSVLKGTQSLVLVLVLTDEYPEYTGNASEFNDRVSWKVSASGNTGLEGWLDVNSIHGALKTAERLGRTVDGSPAYLLDRPWLFTAPGDADLDVSVSLTARNVSDSNRPSTVKVGVFPLVVEQANMPASLGANGTTDLCASYVSARIPTNGVAYVTGEPQPADLSARFTGLPEWIPLQWRATLRTERSERRDLDNRGPTAWGSPGDSRRYSIKKALSDEIVGGACLLECRVGQIPARGVTRFYIRGKNPPDATVRDYIAEHVDADFLPFAWAIAKHETLKDGFTYNQFNATTEKKELLNLGPPDGWGIAQIDRSFNRRQVEDGKATLPAEETFTSTAEAWNWKESVRAMNKTLRNNKKECNEFVRYIRSEYGNLPNWTEPTGYLSINGFSLTYRDWGIMTLYNGKKGLPRHKAGMRNLRSPIQFDPARGEWILHQNANRYTEAVAGHILSEPHD